MPWLKSASIASIAATVLGLFAASVSAQSPPSFSPAISNHLNVTYGTIAVNPAGITVPGNSVIDPPVLGLCSDNSTSYITVMMDFSVSGVLPEGNTTLIHWIQGNFTASNCTQHFTSSSSAIAPYQPPSPPAGQTHTYGVFLYEQPAKFALSADYIPFFKNLTTSIYNRVGFNLTKFVEETGLGLPVGANWFLVGDLNATTSSSAGTATGTGPSSTTSAASSSSSVQATSDCALIKVGMIGVMVGLFGAMINFF